MSNKNKWNIKIQYGDAVSYYSVHAQKTIEEVLRRHYRFLNIGQTITITKMKR